MKNIFLITIVIIFIISSTKHIQASVKSTKPLPGDTVLTEVAPQFALKDMNGKTVSLTDFTGKVVILDFWATWCVPCRSSFPAMQITMNKYKDDKDVVFLFIDTREKSPNYKQLVSKFLSENHYDFYVLLDEKSDDGGQNKMYKAYELIGIPTKFVIDRKGIIRFKNIGFDPDKSIKELVKELSSEIESAKKALD